MIRQAQKRLLAIPAYLIVATGLAAAWATVAATDGSLTAAGVIWLIVLGLFGVRGQGFRVVFGLGFATALLTRPLPEGWVQWAAAAILAVGLTWLFADHDFSDEEPTSPDRPRTAP